MLDDGSKQRVKDLCDLIAKEQDHKRFSMLIQELNQLLDGVQPSSEDGARTGIPPTSEKRS
ncbi:MAG TPA: hypothetical protein VKQ11_01735 [Candidatus Sulfotelmatobacter sp.]|nr:hypothetical protein [Candidatus Sulfotelmatobacter sp.]